MGNSITWEKAKRFEKLYNLRQSYFADEAFEYINNLTNNHQSVGFTLEEYVDEKIISDFKFLEEGNKTPKEIFSKIENMKSAKSVIPQKISNFYEKNARYPIGWIENGDYWKFVERILNPIPNVVTVTHEECIEINNVIKYADTATTSINGFALPYLEIMKIMGFEREELASYRLDIIYTTGVLCGILPLIDNYTDWVEFSESNKRGMFEIVYSMIVEKKHLKLPSTYYNIKKVFDNKVASLDKETVEIFQI